LKESILKVPKEIIDSYTPESEEVTREMAMRLAEVIPSDVQVAVTGLTTPGGSETPEKPVGTIFVHGLIKGSPFKLRKVFKGSCEEVIHQTITAIAELLTEQLSK